MAERELPEGMGATDDPNDPLFKLVNDVGLRVHTLLMHVAEKQALAAGPVGLPLSGMMAIAQGAVGAAAVFLSHGNPVRDTSVEDPRTFEEWVGDLLRAQFIDSYRSTIGQREAEAAAEAGHKPH